MYMLEVYIKSLCGNGFGQEAEQMTWARFERRLKMCRTVSVLEGGHVTGTHVQFTRHGVKDGNCPNI